MGEGDDWEFWRTRKSPGPWPGALCLMIQRSARLRRHQRGDAADGDATVGTLFAVGLDLQVALAITLRGKVLRRDVVELGEQVGDCLGTLIGEDEVGFVRTDGIGVAFNEESLAWVAVLIMYSRL